jgi:phosphoglycerate dehydrogenase-like enzyme
MARKKILVLSPLPEELIEVLFKTKTTEEQLQDLQVMTYKGSTKEELIESVSDAYVIIGDYTNNVAMDADVFRAATRCIFVQQPSTGYQHIDVDEAARQGIPVASASGANSIAVAEHTMMAILGCLKKLILCHDKTRNAEWVQDEMANYGVFELYQKTLGIIGAGHIGREVARRARPFGCRMIYYDIVPLAPEEEEKLGLSFRSVDDLISESDVVTLHVPLTAETNNFISAERIAGMKPGAILINTSRGQAVDEAALAAALREGRLGGAGIDVFSKEPVSADNPLLDAPYTMLTSHTAGATNEARLRIIDLSLSNVADVLNGKMPVNIINGVEPRFE